MSKFNLKDMKNFNKSEVERIISKSDIDKDKIFKVTLVLDNDYTFYNIIKNYTEILAKKKEKNQFNFGLALKGIQGLIDKGVKDIYICNKNTSLDKFLSKEERLYLYNSYLRDIIEELEEL